jgi:hypothetical protein
MYRYMHVQPLEGGERGQRAERRPLYCYGTVKVTTVEQEKLLLFELRQWRPLTPQLLGFDAESPPGINHWEDKSLSASRRFVGKDLREKVKASRKEQRATCVGAGRSVEMER